MTCIPILHAAVFTHPVEGPECMTVMPVEYGMAICRMCAERIMLLTCSTFAGSRALSTVLVLLSMNLLHSFISSAMRSRPRDTWQGTTCPVANLSAVERHGFQVHKYTFPDKPSTVDILQHESVPAGSCLVQTASPVCLWHLRLCHAVWVPHTSC